MNAVYTERNASQCVGVVDPHNEEAIILKPK